MRVERPAGFESMAAAWTLAMAVTVSFVPCDCRQRRDNRVGDRRLRAVINELASPRDSAGCEHDGLVCSDEDGEKLGIYQGLALLEPGTTQSHPASS